MDDTTEDAENNKGNEIVEQTQNAEMTECKEQSRMCPMTNISDS